MCKVFDTFVGPVENGMTRLESLYVHDTSRELRVTAITSRGCPEWSVLDKSLLCTRMCTCVHYFVRHAFRGSNLSVFSIRKIRCDRDGTYSVIESLFRVEVDSTWPHFT